MKIRTSIFASVLLLAASLHAQTITAVATYNNIGVEVVFSSSTSGSATIDMAIKIAGSSDSYKPIHSLSRISSTKFAGSAFWLSDNTTYSIRLSSSALGANRFITVTTRNDKLPDASGTTYHVNASTGNDSRSGLSSGSAFKTLGKALDTIQGGDEILLYNGHYYEGDFEIPSSRSGTPSAPTVIRNAPGHKPVLDGTDPLFDPVWILHDAGRQIYKTRCIDSPYNAYLNGEQFYHYLHYSALESDPHGQGSGYYVDSAYLYAKFPGGAGPSGNTITIPKHDTGLMLYGSHTIIEGLEICYYGVSGSPKGIYIYGGDSNTIRNCYIHHTSRAVGIKSSADHTTIEHCLITESPVGDWSWSAVKYGNIPYESNGIQIFYRSNKPNIGTVIRNNVFSNMFDGSYLCTGYQERNASAITSNTDVHDNKFIKCQDDCIETDGYGSNLRFYHNVFEDFYGGGISVAPLQTGPAYIMRNAFRASPSFSGIDDARIPIKFNGGGSGRSTQFVYIYHNTMFSDVAGQSGFVIWTYSNWDDIYVRNNIFAGTTYGIYATADPNPMDLDYNCYYQTGPFFGRWEGVRYDTFNELRSAAGIEASGINTDPRMANGPAGDLYLAQDSPLIDQAVLIPGINDDHLGSAPDMGAYEYGAEYGNVVLSATGATMTVTASSGVDYQLQQCSDIDNPQWAQAGAVVTAMTANVVMHDSSAQSANRRFYRIVRLPED